MRNAEELKLKPLQSLPRLKNRMECYKYKDRLEKKEKRKQNGKRKPLGYERNSAGKKTMRI